MGSEQRLWQNVLAMAVHDILTPVKPAHKEAALRWLVFDDEGVGSASWICHHLDLSFEALEAWARRRAYEHWGSSFFAVMQQQKLF